ncbi:MAG: hypothetical protein APF77_08565 [Clostridia bacterium BRH_c25]|nr:MAG: hypothetical protein APF77_08565 [Clostridia bacterium BRH_c25]
MYETIQIANMIKEKYNSLSIAQKKAADYIYKNLGKAAFNTAIQLGIEAGVSDSTIIRLSYALGFRSFSAMQETIQKQIMEAANPSYKAVVSEGTVPEDVPDAFTQIVENEILTLRSLLYKLNAQDVRKAAEALINADQVLIMGYFSAFTAAYEFYLNLSMMRSNVFFYRTSEIEFQRLYNLTDKSVVVAVSFPKHIKDIVKFTRDAKKQGATIISVTDMELSPVSCESDISFTVDINSDNETGLILMSSAMTLMYLIIMSIKTQNREKVIAQLENARNNLAEQDVYL